MIAAIVLYVIGTDQLKGFAVTLLIGVVTSMYTSVFVSHVIFEIAEKRQWLTKVKMLRLIGHTKIDFMSWFPYCFTASLLITIMAIVVSFYRGQGLFDIDFTGGVSVQVEFKQPQQADEVRKLLGDRPEADRLKDLAITDVRVGDQDKGLQFIVNTSEPSMDKVKRELAKVFGDKLAHNSLPLHSSRDHSRNACQGTSAASQGSPPRRSRPSRRRKASRAAICRCRAVGFHRSGLVDASPWPTTKPRSPPTRS